MPRRLMRWPEKKKKGTSVTHITARHTPKSDGGASSSSARYTNRNAVIWPMRMPMRNMTRKNVTTSGRRRRLPTAASTGGVFSPVRRR